MATSLRYVFSHNTLRRGFFGAIVPKMRPVLHVLPHTHWDREWFVPSGFTREWLVPFFDALFDRFDSDPGYRFTLDGQSILIEDYLSQLGRERGGRALARIEALVRDGRLIVGPYYQQPDWQLVGGEALIRNLLIGIDDTAPLGARRPIGWLMDNFGQIAQCVQIHAEFAVGGLFAWRGFDLLPDRVRSDLWWESPDGSRLPVVYLLDSYRNGMRLFSRPTILPQRLTDATERIAGFCDDGQLLLMNGYDQEMDPERPTTIPAGFEVRVSAPAEYLAAKSRRSSDDRPVVRGSQYSGRFISVFPGILSARNYLKVANDLAQAMQARYLEPLVTVLAQAGGAAATERVEALRDELALVWRLLLQNHPHDTICGVSSDPVHEEAELRLTEIEQRQMRVVAQVARQLGIDPCEHATPRCHAVFNPSLHERRAMIDGRWSAPVAPLSVTWVGPPDAATPPRPVTAEELDGAMRLANERIVVTVGADGSIALGSHNAEESAVRVTWRDGGDAGDSYTFDRPAEDAPRAVTVRDGAFTLVARSADRVVVELSGVYRLPTALAASRSRRTPEETDNPATLRVELRSTETVIHAAIVLDNRSRDHRLQLVVEAPSGTGAGLRVLNQFAWEDPAHHRERLTPYREDQLPPEVRRLMLGAREPEAPRFVPNDRAFAVGSDAGAALVVHRGLHELEPLPDGSVAATVVRSVGWLARGDLASRTGDAGPEIFTPQAQCRRRIAVPVWLAALDSLAASQNEAAARLVETALHPAIVIGSSDRRAGPLPDVVAALGSRPVARPSDDSGVMLSACKIREDGAGAIVRLFNPTGRAATVDWSCPVTALTAAERAPLPAQSARSSHEIAPYRIYTVALPDAPDTARLRSHRDRSAAERFASALDGALPYRRFESVPRYLAANGWALLAPARDVTTAAPRVTEDHDYLRATLASERERLGRLEASLSAAQTVVGASEHGASAADISRVSTLRRQVLEAELSVLFTERLCHGGDRDQLYRRIRAIALDLNHARVAKRADDYLVALHRE